MTPESQESNWFSAQSSLKVYGWYLNIRVPVSDFDEVFHCRTVLVP